MKYSMAIFALAFLTSTVHADIQADIETIRGLAREGSDVAQIQAALLNGVSENEALEVGSQNYVIRDFDGDGITDLVVIFEQNPRLLDDNGQACSHEDWQTGCRIEYGPRTLQFWNGQKNGKLYNLVSENNKIVLGADEGGVFGEPLLGLSLNKKGSLILSFYGGSAWRWSMDFTFQFRKNDLFLIGYDDYSGWTGDGRSETSSTNYLTGTVVKSKAKSGNAKTHYSTSKIPVQPLQSLSEVTSNF